MTQFLYVEAAETALELHEAAVDRAAFDEGEKARRIKAAQDEVRRQMEALA